MSKVMRSVKNVTKGYSSIQVKVRNATSNDAWGPTGQEMAEISQITFNAAPEFYEVMDMLDKRLNDKGKNWRHVYKALKVLDYALHEGSELVVTWARKNVYIIKTLREFQYIDEDGRDVGATVRQSAKELSALLSDEERLRAERSDRTKWKSRQAGNQDFDSSSPPHDTNSRPHRHRAQRADEEDAEYRLAIEASKHQEEEDRKKRESRGGAQPDDDDLAKAIKLSREEEELRRKELEESNAHSLFDDDPVQNPAMTNFIGYNGGYQQGGAVDWSANPIQQQTTGFPTNLNQTGYPNQYPNGYQNGFNQQPTGYDLYGQQQVFQPQPNGYNPYAQQSGFGQQQQQQQPEPTIPMQTGTNNPWATSSQQAAQPQMPMPTGSNNPFASSFTRPSTSSGQRTQPTLGVLREQKSLSQFNNHPSFNPATSFTPQPTPSKEQDPHQAKLNALLASGDGMDTFGNTGNLRIPAQHTAPGTFVNSAAHGLGRINEQATGNNPFMNSQFTGMPQTSYGAQNGFGGRQIPAATGPAGGFGQYNNNPFGQRPQQQQQQQGGSGDLISF